MSKAERKDTSVIRAEIHRALDHVLNTIERSPHHETSISIGKSGDYLGSLLRDFWLSALERAV